MLSVRIRKSLGVLTLVTLLVPTAASGQGYEVRDTYGHIGGAAGRERPSFSGLSPVERAAVYREQQGQLSSAPRRVTSVTTPPVSVGRSVPPPPPSSALETAPPRAPVASRALTVEERAGRASRLVDEVAKEVRDRTKHLKAVFLEALADFEKAPRWDEVREAERLGHFLNLLKHAIDLGRLASADKAGLEKSLEQYRALSLQAGPVYREAAAVFAKRKKEAEFDDERKILELAEKHYEARAARASLVQGLPTDFTTQLRRVVKMTQALELVHEYASRDPYYLHGNADVATRLLAFQEAFRAVNDVLSTYTAKLMEDMEPVPSSSESNPPAAAAKKPSA